jgi:DNA ligase-1
MTGSLTCEMENGKTFDVGSGLTDHRRTDKGRPKVSSGPSTTFTSELRLTLPSWRNQIGAIINYRFQELTKSGVPRFPTFVGERIDATEPKDALVRPKSTSPDA